MAVLSDKCLKISSVSGICPSVIGGTSELRSDCDKSPNPPAGVPVVGFCWPMATEAS